MVKATLQDNFQKTAKKIQASSDGRIPMQSKG